VVTISGYLGATVMVSVARDVLSLLMLHVFYFNALSTRLFKVMLSILSSLWKLFRGNQQQLILGTFFIDNLTQQERSRTC